MVRSYEKLSMTTIWLPGQVSVDSGVTGRRDQEWRVPLRRSR
jgi:hypothetical protein